MPTYKTDVISHLLRDWLKKRLESTAENWIDERCESIRKGNLQALYLGFGLVSRKIPKMELDLCEEELEQAGQARPDWQPEFWSLQDTARTLFVLEYSAAQPEQFLSVLDHLFSAGEVHELIALYQALAVLPEPERLRQRAGEGIRTNMQSVFRAVAHRNPFPCEQLDEGMWNQMVLKCLFIGVPLHPVFGLDSRTNPALSQMLCDYAHERWAAKRAVHPELWRCVRPEMTPNALDDLQRVIEQGDELEKQAAALALAASSLPEAKQLLKANQPKRLAEIEAGRLNWGSLYHALQKR